MKKATIGKLILKSIIFEAAVATGFYAYRRYKADKNFFKKIFSNSNIQVDASDATQSEVKEVTEEKATTAVKPSVKRSPRKKEEAKIASNEVKPPRKISRKLVDKKIETSKAE